jgi:Carboxypeptidase Taq (M32) metallopeptidase
MRRIVLHGAAVPTSLIGAISPASSRAEMVWREARRNSDFVLLLPHLTEVLRLQREVGALAGQPSWLSNPRRRPFRMKGLQKDQRSSERMPRESTKSYFLQPAGGRRSKKSGGTAAASTAAKPFAIRPYLAVGCIPSTHFGRCGTGLGVPSITSYHVVFGMELYYVGKFLCLLIFVLTAIRIIRLPASSSRVRRMAPGPCSRAVRWRKVAHL